MSLLLEKRLTSEKQDLKARSVDDFENRQHVNLARKGVLTRLLPGRFLKHSDYIKIKTIIVTIILWEISSLNAKLFKLKNQDKFFKPNSS